MQLTDQLYTEKQIRELEQMAIDEGISVLELMQRAGRAAFDWLRRYWPQAYSIVVFCGCGNNGGDGYVLALLAQQYGLDVRVRYVGDLKTMKPEAARAKKLCSESKIEIKPFDSKEKFEANIFVDALLGIGLKFPLRKPMLEAIQYLNQVSVAVLSLDVPSGLQADTGYVETEAVKATCTITFLGIKRGLVTDAGLNCTGELVCHDLDLSGEFFKKIKPSVISLDSKHILNILKPRERHAHKGNFGHVLVMGGNEGMSGAPRIAALGALRVGAGLVSVATHPSHANFVNILQPEIMSQGIQKPKDLSLLLEKATVLVAGPGLGQTRWSEELLEIILESKLPMIVDADALNYLAKNSCRKKNWILTPHPGEAARLLNVDKIEIQQNRFEAAATIQKKYGGVCILKGAGTLIVDESQKIFVCVSGNPGMASGGMGDLLSGILGGVLAQGLTLSQAAKVSVGLHAKAGEIAAREGERGLLATDLLPFIYQLVNEK